MMRGVCGLIGIGFCFLSLLAGAAAQEPEKPLTAEEIVAKNEASWKKLGRVAVSFEAKNRISTGSTEIRIKPSGEKYNHFAFRTYDSASNGRLYLDHERSCGVFGRDVQTREIFEKDILTYLRPGHVSYEKVPDYYPRPDRFTFGRALALFHMCPQVSLRDWVAEAHPVVSKSVDSTGKTLWTLKGSLTPPATPRQPKGTAPQQVTVVFNAARGYLVERIDFDCEKDSHELAAKTSRWVISQWSDLGEGVYFPGKIRCDVTYWNHDEVNYLDWTLTDFKRDPVDFEEQFKVTIPPGATVFDNTGRAGVAPVVVYGEDGKPARTYASYKEYETAQQSEKAKQVVRDVEQWFAKEYPDYKAKIIWIEATNDYHTTLCSADGKVVLEFENEYQLAGFMSMHDALRIALAGEEKVR